jgi:hypothetical protein
MATIEIAKRLMETIIFTTYTWPILSDDKYSMVEQAWKLAIEAQDRQWASACAHIDISSMCQLPGGRSLPKDPQTRKGASLECFLIRLNQIYGYGLPPQIYLVKTEDYNHFKDSWQMGHVERGSIVTSQIWAP